MSKWIQCDGCEVRLKEDDDIPLADWFKLEPIVYWRTLDGELQDDEMHFCSMTCIKWFVTERLAQCTL